MTGLMMGMMEPPPNYDDEFNDWNDLEHVPSRAVVPGFLSANRFVCVEGFPRYVAMYDLENLDVLNSPAYLAISGAKNSSPWSARMVSKVHGYYRCLGVQLYPGDAIMGGKGRSSRVMVLRFNAPPEDAVPDILAGLKAEFEGKPETAQVRFFRSEFEGLYYVGIVELRRPVPIAGIDVTKFGRGGEYLDMINVYQHYVRGKPAHTPR